MTSEKSRIVPCRDCGGLQRESLHPHGVRWLKGADVGTWLKVDCVGRVLATFKNGVGASTPQP